MYVLMTGQEFTAALAALDLTQAQLAREVGMHRTTLYRYQTGEVEVPKLMECYIKLRRRLCLQMELRK